MYLMCPIQYNSLSLCPTISLTLSDCSGKHVWGMLVGSLFAQSCTDHKFQTYYIYYLSKKHGQNSMLSSECERRKCCFAHAVKLVPHQGNRWEWHVKIRGIFAEHGAHTPCCVKWGQQQGPAQLHPWVYPQVKACWQRQNEVMSLVRDKYSQGMFVASTAAAHKATGLLWWR